MGKGGDQERGGWLLSRRISNYSMACLVAVGDHRGGYWLTAHGGWRGCGEGVGRGWREESSKQVQGVAGRGGRRQRRQRRKGERERREGKEGREGGREERRNYQKVSVEPPQRYRTVVLKQRDM